MTEKLSSSISQRYLRLNLPKAGRYHVIFRFLSRPFTNTLVALHDSDSLTADMEFLPLFNGTHLDITTTKDSLVFYACHSALEEIQLIEAPASFQFYSYGNLFGRIHKRYFPSGNFLRIRRIGNGILTIVKRKAEQRSQLQAIWNEIVQASLAARTVHPSVPARFSQQWRKCLLAAVATEGEILAALKLQHSVDEIILVLLGGKITERERRIIPSEIKALFAQDENDVYFSLLKASGSGLLSDFEFVGLCFQHEDNGRPHPDEAEHLSDPLEQECEALFGSRKNVDAIISVFESDKTVAMVESPLRSMFRHSFATRLALSPEQLDWKPGSAWFRIKSLEAILPSALAAIEDKHPQSDVRQHWRSFVDQSLGVAGFTTATKLWADLRDGEPADVADFRILRPLENPEAKKVCLFACFAANGELRPHAFHFMRELRRMGYLVLVLAANDRSDLEMIDPGPETCDGLIARENIGYDFALWAAALLHDPRLFAAKELVLVNDSLVGPLVPLDRFFDSIRRTKADVVGLVDSYQRNYHCQSFFFLLRRRAIASDAFIAFIKSVRSYSDKEEVIKQYELEFYSLMTNGSLSFNIQFPTAKFSGHNNPTVQYWRQLLALGFPFVKLQVVQLNPLMDDLSDLPAIMSLHADKEYVESAFRSLKTPHMLS